MVIKRVPPKYPANALASHIQGVVEIEATISKEGVVLNPKVLSGDRMLAAAALENSSSFMVLNGLREALR